MLWFVLLIISLFAVLFIGFKKSPAQNSPKKSHAKAIQPTKNYHCVTVKFGRQACTAVKQLDNQRILSAEAPTLPLSDCDVASCQCRFQHHDERREGERRGLYNKTLEELAGTTMQMNPRQGNDRRRVDPDDLKIV